MAKRREEDVEGKKRLWKRRRVEKRKRREGT
jgi:hypothetical protein